MAEVTFSVTPATPQKRNHDEFTELNRQPEPKSTPINTEVGTESVSRHNSPSPSTASSLTDLTTINNVLGSAIKSSASSTKASPSKKRKLGYIEAQADKAAKQREKEERARQKAEDKARKDEEKRRIAEEKENVKRMKELEKAEKQKAKDEEKQKKDAEKALKDAEKAQKEAERREKEAVKEAEKAKKEAEQLRKERSQLRLVAFFGKPKPEATPPSTPEDVSEGATSRRSSIASIDMDRPILEPPKTTKSSNPEYEKFILPFFVPEHTDIAPVNRFKLGRQVDFELTQLPPSTTYNIREHFGRPRKRMKRTVPIRDVIRNIQATGLDVTDLGNLSEDAFGHTAYKCLQFREDVRPPYQGTYSRLVSPRTSRKICRDPFARQLPSTNYDYDSEAEWEPPGEDDEDLGDEDEMSDVDEAGDEMADFLDDENDIARKRGPLSDMEPVSSGLCWVGHTFNDKGTNLSQYRMDVLHDSVAFPIDPFSSKHWIEETKSKPSITPEANSSTMQPPRQPLSTLSPNATSTTKSEVGIDGKILPVTTSKKVNSNRPPKLIPANLMADFKTAVEGSDLTKTGLIEVLKKQFPQCSKDAIKDTLGVIAVRVGKKETEKKWELVESN